MANEIAEIEKRRYIELEKQRAAHGISTSPEIMLEIADLRQKYGPVEYIDSVGKIPSERRRKMDLDIEFIIAQIGTLTHRQLHLETAMRIISRNVYLVGALALVALIGVLLYVAHAI